MGKAQHYQGKQKLELAKTVDVTKMTLDKALALLEKNAPKKKKVAKKKTTAKKTTAKKTTVKKKATTKKK